MQTFLHSELWGVLKNYSMSTTLSFFCTFHGTKGSGRLKTVERTKKSPDQRLKSSTVDVTFSYQRPLTPWVCILAMFEYFKIIRITYQTISQIQTQSNRPVSQCRICLSAQIYWFLRTWQVPFQVNICFHFNDESVAFKWPGNQCSSSLTC